jgi:hypothetical protein
LRRIDKAELELREVKVGTGNYDDYERRGRVRVLKRWLAQDSERLRVLLGAKNQL